MWMWPSSAIWALRNSQQWLCLSYELVTLLSLFHKVHVPWICLNFGKTGRNPKQYFKGHHFDLSFHLGWGWGWGWFAQPYMEVRAQFFFHQVGTGIGIEVLSLGHKCLCPWSHFTDPIMVLMKKYKCELFSYYQYPKLMSNVNTYDVQERIIYLLLKYFHAFFRNQQIPHFISPFLYQMLSDTSST